MSTPGHAVTSSQKLPNIGVPLWKAALLLIPILFCIWTASLIISVARIRQQVENQVGYLTRLGSIDQAFRHTTDSLLAGGTESGADAASWNRLRFQLDTAIHALSADPAIHEGVAAEVTELRVVTFQIDTLRGALRGFSASAPARTALEARLRGMSARGSDLTSNATRRLRAHLAELSADLGRRWQRLSLVAVTSILLALVSTLLAIAYDRSLQQGRRLLAELRASLAEVKQLQGILPICSYCKRVRDDKNYWQQVEIYVSQRTAAQFSHGICPACLEKHFSNEMDVPA